LPGSTKPRDVLTRCAELIEERGQTHGDYVENMETIAKLWSAFLGIEIPPYKVPIMFSLSKAARMKHEGPDGLNIDDYEDLTSYGSIGTAIAEKTLVKTSGQTVLGNDCGTTTDNEGDRK